MGFDSEYPWIVFGYTIAFFFFSFFFFSSLRYIYICLPFFLKLILFFSSNTHIYIHLGGNRTVTSPFFLLDWDNTHTHSTTAGNNPLPMGSIHTPPLQPITGSSPSQSSPRMGSCHPERKSSHKARLGGVIPNHLFPATISTTETAVGLVSPF